MPQLFDVTLLKFWTLPNTAIIIERRQYKPPLHLNPMGVFFRYCYCTDVRPVQTLRTWACGPIRPTQMPPTEERRPHGFLWRLVISIRLRVPRPLTVALAVCSRRCTRCCSPRQTRTLTSSLLSRPPVRAPSLPPLLCNLYATGEEGDGSGF
jgi:hypothetical protein